MAYEYNYDREEVRYKPTLLKTNRNVWKLIVLSVVTLGIYPIFFFIPLAFDLDKAAPRRDGKRTMNYLLAFILSLFTFSIVIDIWHYLVADRIEDALAEQKIAYDFGTGTFWGWLILGSLILVGPFVYMHKLCRAMNLLCENYNTRIAAEAEAAAKKRSY